MNWRRSSAVKKLGSILRGMVNAQNFNALVNETVDDDIRQRREQKLSRSFLAPDTAALRPLFQRDNRLIQFADGRLGVTWMVLLKVVTDVLQVRYGSRRPAKLHFQERNICSNRASISSSSM